MRVLVYSMSEDGPSRLVEGFADAKAAEAFACEVMRRSLAEHYRPGMPKDELLRLWTIYGECASVPETGWSARGQFDRLIVELGVVP